MNAKNIGRLANDYRAVIIMVAFALVLGLVNPTFLQLSNITNILNQSSVNALLAAGLTIVILTGGIDISVGSILGFTGAIAAIMLVGGIPVLVVVPTVLAIGVLAGALNGLFISRWRLQPMIVTLASLSIFRGATYLVTNGSPLTVNDAAFNFIGGGSLFGAIPMPVVLMVVVFALAYYLLTRTPFGRHIYAVGGNEDAAYLSGVSVRRTKLLAYSLSGLGAALAGIVVTSRLTSAQPLAGQSYELDAIAAAVIGGTSLKGGAGRILLTVVGALIIGMPNNALNLMNVPSYYQTIVKGVVILAAVLVDAAEARQK
jgi:ribose transport system permease protein